MVRSWVLRFISGVALACTALVTLPRGAAAQQPQPTDLRFETAITSAYGSPYPITGRLDIQIFPAGNLRGYYHTSYNKLFIDVVGGRDGDYIWFDIGPSSVDLGLGAGPQGKLHVVATMNPDGSFRGQVYPQTAAVLSGVAMQNASAGPAPPYNGLANPTPLNGNPDDQWIFAAKPTTEIEPTPNP